MGKFHYYKSTKDGLWYWRFRADNGKIVADSSEGYVNKTDCLHGIDIVKREAPMAGDPVEVSSKPT